MFTSHYLSSPFTYLSLVIPLSLSLPSPRSPQTEGREEKNALLRDCVFPALKEGVDLFLAEAREESAAAGGAPPSVAAVARHTGSTEAEARRWLAGCR